LDPILADVEREAIRRALRAANWQRNKAAQLMGISRSRLYRRMEALGINPNERG
jgi:transcriptional regulator of acetoin/glycerol metabolism